MNDDQSSLEENSSVTASVLPSALRSSDDSIKTAAHIISSKTPSEYIEEAGINLLALYKNLGRIATDARLWVKDRDGEAVDIGPNDKMQVQATMLILELLKHIKDKTGGETINYNMTIVQRNELIQRVNRLYGVDNAAGS